MTDGDVSPGAEEYGISSNQAGNDIIQINDANNDGVYTQDDCTFMNNKNTTAMPAIALTNSDKSWGGSSGPLESVVWSLCHAAAITGTTAAGSYSQQVTITIVGNF